MVYKKRWKGFVFFYLKANHRMIREVERLDNALPTTYNHINNFYIKCTHYAGKDKLYIDANLNAKITHEILLKKNLILQIVKYKNYF